mmetsp:Transcript_98/g.211  ORF Transcript_98/g.211 Transcript_98/m.211 type:complete len:253 (-) Transcript_98:371-1129(-)
MSIAIKNKFFSVVLPTVLAAVALILSACAAIDCAFVQFVIPPATYGHEHVGLWGYQWWDREKHKYICLAYPEEMVIDGKWKAARGFSCLALTFGAVAVANELLRTCKRCCCRKLLSTRVRCCANVGASVRHQEPNLYLACSLCSSLSLLFLHSNACQHNKIFNLMGDHACRLSTGAKCTYAAMALWFGASSLVMFREEGDATEEGVEPRNSNEVESATVPLIQDVVFECEQSTYSGRSKRSGRSGRSSLVED